MQNNYTEARKKATLKYLRKLKSISIRVKEEQYNKYQAAAQKAQLPLRQFILTAMDEKIDRDI